MTGVYISSDGEIGIKDFVTHADIENNLGGYIELVRPCGLSPKYFMLVNEEGLIKELPINVLASYLYGTFSHGAPIVGNVIIFAANNTLTDFTGINISDAKHLEYELEQVYKLLTGENAKKANTEEVSER